MNATRSPRTAQLTFEIDAQHLGDEFAGSPAVLEPWVASRSDRALEVGALPTAEPGIARIMPLPPVAFRQPMTARQRGFLFALAREHGMTADDVHAWAVEHFRVASVADLDRRQASEMIRLLQDAPAMPVAS
ncbi:MAG: hypothetical protein IT335_15065 [Thermomicrobiales bacterium]|nr:hypothetical protein [Thermomicrobiales bacterium]